ncbi:hypothetical protein D3C86_2079050 [compost metagenome]
MLQIIRIILFVRVDEEEIELVPLDMQRLQGVQSRTDHIHRLVPITGFTHVAVSQIRILLLKLQGDNPSLRG